MLNRLLESQFFDPWNELSQKKSLNKFASLEKQFQIEPIYHQSYYFQFSQFIKNIPFRVETCTIELIIRSKNLSNISLSYLMSFLCCSAPSTRPKPLRATAYLAIKRRHTAPIYKHKHATKQIYKCWTEMPS